MVSTRRIEKLTSEKLIENTKTVLKFTQIYCDDKHIDEKKLPETLNLEFKCEPLNVALDYHLCSTCKEVFLYSYQKLQECEHEEKPSCRKCPSPCYERPKWKQVTQIMKYSGMKLGLLKIKKLFTSIKN